MENRNFYQLLIFCWTLWLIACSGNSLKSEMPTDIPNTISGVVKDGGEPVSGAVVTLFPDDFNPIEDKLSDSMQILTDQNGNYKFDVKDTGQYNIHIVRKSDLASALVLGVEVSSLDNTVISVPDAILQSSSVLTLDISEKQFDHVGTIYIPGTGISTDITQGIIDLGILTISDLPSQSYSAIIYVDGMDSSSQNIIEEPIDLQPGENEKIGPFHNWQDTLKIKINTNLNGANISEELYHFPLLVRIDTSRGALFYQQKEKLNQLFLTTKGDGADLRFSNPKGTISFPYQIERWDSIEQIAEVWVLVDTIYGNNDSQLIYMFWGNRSAKSNSNGQDVFEVNNGYSGVWHLDEKDNLITGGYKDVTSNLNHATGFSMTGDSLVEGVIGNCQDLDGLDDYLVVPNSPSLDLGNSFTIMLWVKWESSAIWQSYPRILDRKNPFNGSDGWSVSIGPNLDDKLTILGADSLQGNSTGSIKWSDGNWEHLAVNFNDSIALVFLNGMVVDSVNILPVIDNDKDLYIGQYPGEFQGSQLWNGKLDEIRLSDQMRSPDWIKLSYENQNGGSTVLSIE